MEYGTVPILKLLANDVRFTALAMLSERRQGVLVSFPAGAIAEKCGVSPSACSQALSLLKLAGLVTVERQRTERIYRLREPIHPLVWAALFYDVSPAGDLAPLFLDVGTLKVHYPEGVILGEEVTRSIAAYDAGREA